MYLMTATSTVTYIFCRRHTDPKGVRLSYILTTRKLHISQMQDVRLSASPIHPRSLTFLTALYTFLNQDAHACVDSDTYVRQTTIITRTNERNEQCKVLACRRRRRKAMSGLPAQPVYA